MQTPLQIAFRGLDRSDAVEERIREKIAKLDQMYDRIIGCRVVIGIVHKTSGNPGRTDEPFEIGIEMSIPGANLVVKRTPDVSNSGEDVFFALKDAFSNLERQLKTAFNR